MDQIFKSKAFFACFILYCGAISCSHTSDYTKVNKSKSLIEVQATNDKSSPMGRLSQRGGISKSVESLKDNISKNPRTVRSLLNLAQLQIVQNKLNDAEHTVRIALKKDLKNQLAKKILAQILIRKGQTDMASIILTGLGGAKSRDSQIINLLAMTALKDKKNAQALALFKQALKLNPNDISVRMNLGVQYIKYRQLSNAAIQFERILKVMPNHLDAKLHLAIIQATKENFSVAEDTYKDILSRSSNNPLTLFNLAVLEKRRKNYDDALDTLNTYLDSNYAKNANNEEVYALLNEIKRRQQEMNIDVSDSEIQNLADKLNNQSPKEEVNTSKTGKTRPTQPNTVNAKREVRKVAKKSKPRPKPRSYSKPQSVEDEIDALEKELE